MPKLTKTVIDRARPSKSDLFLWDNEIPGFGVRLKPTGTASFLIQYRNDEGRSRRLTIGRYGVLTVEEARKLARLRLAEVAHGQDPREVAATRRSGATMRELGGRFLTEHAAQHKKASSLAEDRRMLERNIYPRLSNLKVSAVTRADIAGLHHAMRDRPYSANRTLALLSKMFGLAELWGLRPDGTNPCRHVKKFKEAKRERLLTAEELARLGAELSTAEAAGKMYPGIVHAIRLLALTGCRVGEIHALQWTDVDLENGNLLLRDAKAGPRTVFIGAPAKELLASLERDGVFIVHGPDPDKPLAKGTTQLAWKRIRKRAGLEDVRLHDLRHLYGSMAGAAGFNAFMVRDLLGHRDVATTSRYVHGDRDPLHAAADHVAGRIAAAMEGREAAEVVSLGRKNRVC